MKDEIKPKVREMISEMRRQNSPTVIDLGNLLESLKTRLIPLAKSIMDFSQNMTSFKLIDFFKVVDKRLNDFLNDLNNLDKMGDNGYRKRMLTQFHEYLDLVNNNIPHQDESPHQVS